MDVLLSQFVRALRNADVRVSPAETLDAFEVFLQIGISNRSLLKDALSMSLAKTVSEKNFFENTFDRFFSSFAFQDAPKRSMLSNVDTNELLEELKQNTSDALVENITHAISGNRNLLSAKVQHAAAEIGVENIHSLREKRSYVEILSKFLRLNELDEFVHEKPRQSEIRYLRQYFQHEVADFVDKQYRIHFDASGKRTIIEAAIQGHLGHIPFEYHEAVRAVIKKIANRLQRDRKRRHVRENRGLLDIKRTLRRNIAYGGNLFDLHWRKSRNESATVFVLCDVSNSVAKVSRFLLLLLYELVDVLPRIRAFVFSSSLGEVTEVFRRDPSEEAIEETLFTWGKGNTDYGRALHDFRDLCRKDLTNRSTIIVLGDARNNYYDPAIQVFREIARRVKQVYWLNPETRDQWQEGDSEMTRYAPHCTRVDLCTKLSDIERFADRLIASVR